MTAGEELTIVLTVKDKEMCDGWDYTDMTRQVVMVEPQEHVSVIVGRRPAPVPWPDDRPSVLVDMQEVVDVTNASDGDSHLWHQTLTLRKPKRLQRPRHPLKLQNRIRIRILHQSILLLHHMKKWNLDVKLNKRGKKKSKQCSEDANFV